MEFTIIDMHGCNIVPALLHNVHHFHLYTPNVHHLHPYSPTCLHNIYHLHPYTPTSFTFCTPLPPPLHVPQIPDCMHPDFCTTLWEGGSNIQLVLTIHLHKHTNKCEDTALVMYHWPRHVPWEFFESTGTFYRRVAAG